MTGSVNPEGINIRITEANFETVRSSRYFFGNLNGAK